MQLGIRAFRIDLGHNWRSRLIRKKKLALPSNGRIGQDHLAKTGSLGTNLTGELGREEAGEELSRRGVARDGGAPR